MKTIKTIKTICCILAAAISLSSCDDFFDLKPTNEMVLDEYWESEDDVLSVTGAAYRAMQEPGFMQRLIVWGEFRSDNVILGSNTGDDLNYIASLNLLPSNGYASWGDFYKVINICNTVVSFAPGVCEKDPNFTQAKMRAYVAEMKAVRAWCYFTLVRAFRDIPLVTEPVIDDTQTFQAAQSAPEEVIDWLIGDLKAVEDDAPAGWTSAAYTKGRMTQAALRTLIAEMSLWKNDYQECITYCDKVLNDPNSRLAAETSAVYNRSLFINGNSAESIFELDFTRTNIPNYTVCEFYGTTGGHSGWGHQQMMANDLISSTNARQLFQSSDVRRYDALYGRDGMASFPIKKYIAYRNEQKVDYVAESDYSSADAGESNWIIYRLPDLWLMKAEALVEKGENLEEAFSLVMRTYDRANATAGAGSLSFSDYSTQARMRELVFDERQREFLFEGKRYWDILRRINHDRTQFSNIVSTYLTPKYVSLDQSTVKAKLSELDGMYMPIKDTELKANLLLEQNPFYKVSSDINKN